MNKIDFSPMSENNEILPSIDQTKIKDFFLKKTKNNSGGYTWVLEKKSALTKLSFLFAKKGEYVSPEDLESLMKASAGKGNKKYEQVISNKQILADKDIMSLIDNEDFEQFARLSTNIPQTPKQKFLRAVESAKVIGKGLKKMEQQPLPGKILSESYWLEAVTKEKYYGGELHQFFEAWEKSDSPLNFQDWLKKENPSGFSYTAWEQKNPQNVETLSHITYLKTPEERKKYEVSFEDGIAKRNGEIFDTAEESTAKSGQGIAIFVMDPDGKIYAGSHVTGEFHHSSFLGGGAVSGAGEIKTNLLGQVTSITNKSGHYKPGKDQILNTLTVLHDNQVDLSDVNLTIQSPTGIELYNAQEYFTTAGNCKPSGIGWFQFERDERDNISGLILSKEGAGYSKREILKNLQESITSLKLPDGTPLSLIRKFGNVTVNYDANEYLQQKGLLPPKSWSGGTFELTDGKITEIRVNEGAQIDKDDMIQFLTYLSTSGVDLMETTLYDETGQKYNANDFFRQLAISR